MVRFAATGPEPVRLASGDVADLLLHIQREGEAGAIYILEDILQALRDSAPLRSHLAALLDPASGEAPADGQLLVLVDVPAAGELLPDLLRAQVPVIRHRLPRARDLRELVKEQLPTAPEDVVGRLAAALAGLPRTRALDVLWEALTQLQRGLDVVEATVRREKAEILRRELGMTFLQTAQAAKPVGLEEVWAYLERHRDRIGVPGPGRLKGLLLVGPPGTGKSMIAKAIGRAIGLPVVNFEIGRLMSPYVGATENNVLRATSVLDALAPLVVYIDEIEKALSGAESSARSDAGTMARAYGSLLSWMNDTEAPLLILGTANRLDRLGEFGTTLSRRGRFDALFFVDTPTLPAREQIVRQALAVHDGVAAGLDLSELAVQSEGFSGADLEGLVIEAVARARLAGSKITNEHFAYELGLLRPQVEARNKEFAGLRQWATAHCRPAAAPSRDATQEGE
jgi:hypothetical protein